MFLLAVALLMGAQLVPLPPDLWTSLPRRELMIRIGDDMGIDQPWRPLSWSPAKTWNSLFSLAVPLAGLLLFALQSKEHFGKLRLLIFGLALFSAVLAMLQMAGEPGNPFYLYRITNDVSPVGLFANRNHHAVFLGCMVLALGAYFTTFERREPYAPLKTAGIIVSIVFFVLLVLVTGSRGGLLITSIALILALVIMAGSDILAPASRKASRIGFFSSRTLALGIAAFVAAAALTAIVSGRSLAVERFLADDGVEGIRLQLLPVYFQIALDFFPWGTGFGSFEHVYRMYEPIELLSYKYLNLAHNDWAQWIIEGGLAGLFIAAGVLGWLVVRSIQVFRSRPGNNRNRRALLLMLFVLLLLASLFDYPLRTPAFMAIVAILAGLLERDASAARR